MKYIKGFDENLCCRGMRFEVGKVYDTGFKDDELSLCSETVFHFCKSLQNVDDYYSVRNNNRYCEIQALGKVLNDGHKCGSNKIKIVREIKGNELDSLKGIANGNTGYRNTGYRNTGNFNTGDYNKGDYNTGYWNTGYRNTGNFNTGDYNKGDYNTGSHNTGDYNTGNFNACDYSNGFFNNINQEIIIFNKPSGLTFNEAVKTKWYEALFSSPFELTKWIKYTEDEKKDSIIRQCIGGYIKKYTFKEACENWWNKMSEENKEIIKNMPNFDALVFKEITGIEVNDND